MLLATEKGLIHVCNFNDIPVSHLPICSELEPKNSRRKTDEEKQIDSTAVRVLKGIRKRKDKLKRVSF